MTDLTPADLVQKDYQCELLLKGLKSCLEEYKKMNEKGRKLGFIISKPSFDLCMEVLEVLNKYSQF